MFINPMPRKMNVRITTINPTTEEILAEYEAISLDQVHREVSDSRKIFKTIWKKIDISERAKLLRNLAHVLEHRKKEYAT